ncbi:hypothetical protein GQ44DRAFT_699339 [Phaeosphaeriaceae sp. PMI808]|nr:hypothetical protein GQ44DRAFT_699339 [Phaeosphaeriaceae sp. PMI808]
MEHTGVLDSPTKAPRPPLRPLLPSTTTQPKTQLSTPKRHRISRACAACRSRRTKCDGLRPKCNECKSRNRTCEYTNTGNGMLKRRHEDLEALWHMLRSFPLREAKELFARIRAGAEPGFLVEQVRHGSMLVSLSGSQGSRESSGSDSKSS